MISTISNNKEMGKDIQTVLHVLYTTILLIPIFGLMGPKNEFVPKKVKIECSFDHYTFSIIIRCEKVKISKQLT